MCDLVLEISGKFLGKNIQ